MLPVKNNRCGGNGRRRGFHAAEWNGTSECAKGVSSGGRDYDIFRVLCVRRAKGEEGGKKARVKEEKEERSRLRKDKKKREETRGNFPRFARPHQRIRIALRP